ncbi:structural protein [Penaeus monodon hepandensovirus 4]|uniref:Structural protein n=2 Tax=Parvoviridae TaxID=10780 RepID=B8XPQ3_9VIRU|nr:structural protein [Penaeus monodon hepandensovirus 4]ACC86066.1 structural protein [Penaeus monodon hepatopancreatic parvovirus]ACJ23371.1 structural protein [Penaeus monodon hepandensovirus 4]
MSPTRRGGNYFASKHFQSKRKNKLAKVKDLLASKKRERRFKGKGNTLSEKPSTSEWNDPVRQRFPALEQEERNTFAGLLAIEAAPDQRQLGRDNNNQLALVQRDTRVAVRQSTSRGEALEVVRAANEAIRSGGDRLAELVRTYASGFSDSTEIVEVRQEDRVQRDIFQEEGQNLLAIEIALQEPSSVALQLDQERTPAVKRALELTQEEEQLERIENAKKYIEEVIEETNQELENQERQEVSAAEADTMNTEAPVPMETSESGATAAPQQRAAAGGGGSGGGGESAGYGRNSSDSFQRHRNKPIDLKHIGDNVYVAQRVYKVEAECKLVGDKLSWSPSTSNTKFIRRLLGINGNSNTGDIKHGFSASLPGSIGLGNLALGNYINSWGMDNISKSEDSWAIIATRGKMNHLQAFEMVPQYQGETIVGYTSAPLQFGKLLGHVYYPDPEGEERIKISSKADGQEAKMFKDAMSRYMLDDDMNQTKITAEHNQVFAFTDLRDSPMISEIAAYQTTDEPPKINGIGIEYQGFNLTLDTNAALIGLMPSNCISKRKEIQSGMDNVVLWSMKSNRLIDKRFWKPDGWTKKSTNGMARDKIDTPPANYDIYQEAHVTRTAEYAEWARTEIFYDAGTSYGSVGPSDNGYFIQKYNLWGQYATSIFFMPYVHTRRGIIQDIIINFDLTLQIMVKRIPRHVYNDFYHINTRAMHPVKYDSAIDRTFGYDEIYARSINIHEHMSGTHGSKYAERGPISHMEATKKNSDSRKYAQRRLILDQGVSRMKTRSSAAAEDDIPEDCDDFLETSEMESPPQPQLPKKKKKYRTVM